MPRPLLLLPLLFALACATPERASPQPAPSEPPRQTSPAREPAPARQAAVVAPTSRVIGRSVEGRPITAIELGTGDETVLMLSTIHGDEAAGTPLLAALVEHLVAHPADLAGRRLVLVPVLNPDGLHADQRKNANGIDLNRDFPASNQLPDRTGTQPESRALAELVEACDPSLVVSFHGWVSVIDWDGPAAELAAAMAAACDLPARRIGSRRGSLGSWLGVDRDVMTITFEFPGSAGRMDRDALFERFGPALLTAIAWESDAP